MKIDKLLFAGYSITLSVMMFFLTYVVSWALLVTPYVFKPEEVVPETISYIPALLMLEAVPLAIFTALFLKRGGGLSYFETWKAGRKLRVSGMLLLLGYTVTTLPALIDVLSRWRFRVLATEQAYINPLYMNPIYIGLSLMLSGLVAFVYLWITRHKEQTENGDCIEWHLR